MSLLVIFFSPEYPQPGKNIQPYFQNVIFSTRNLKKTDDGMENCGSPQILPSNLDKVMTMSSKPVGISKVGLNG